jgi:hypothetical protein
VGDLELLAVGDFEEYIYIYIMASGNAQRGKEESWLAGLEHTVEGFVSGIFPTHKAVAVDSTVSGTIQLKGTLTLRKRLLALDLTDLGGDVVDDLSDVLGGKVTVELVSSTSVDPSKLQLLTKKNPYMLMT